MSDHITDPHASGLDHGLTSALHSPLARVETSKQVRDDIIGTMERTGVSPNIIAAMRELMDGLMHVGAEGDAAISTLTARAEAAERERDEARRAFETAVDDQEWDDAQKDAQIHNLRAELERVTGDLNFSAGRLDYVTDRLQTVVRVLEEECGPWDGAAPVSPVETRIRLLATRARDAEGAVAQLESSRERWKASHERRIADLEKMSSERAQLRADSSRLRAALKEAAETFGTIAANLEGRMYKTAKAQAKRAAKSFTAALSPAPAPETDDDMPCHCGESRRYHNQFTDPPHSYVPMACTCHLSAPCSYCTPTPPEEARREEKE